MALVWMERSEKALGTFLARPDTPPSIPPSQSILKSCGFLLKSGTGDLILGRSSAVSIFAGLHHV
jgi:hypothetical protein